MPFNHLILCCPLLLLSSIFPSIKVFSNESVLCIRWPKCWTFSFNTSPSNEYSGLISFTSLLVELKKNYQSLVDSQCCVNFLMVGSYAFPLSGQSIYFSYLELLVLSHFSLPSHLFIYSVIYLHKYRLTDICFMSVIYFLAQVVSALVTGGFLVRSCVLGHAPMSRAFPYFLVIQNAPGSFFLFRTSTLGSVISPRNPVPLIKVFVYPYLVANNVINQSARLA